MPNFKRSDPGRSKAAFRKQVHVIEFWGWDPASMRKQSDSHGRMGRLLLRPPQQVFTPPAKSAPKTAPVSAKRRSNSGMRASAVIPCPNRQKSITGNDPNGVAFKNVPAVPVKPRSGEPTGSRFLCAELGPTNLLQRLAARCAPQGKWRKSMPTKTREKKSSGGKANALQKPLQPSEELTAVVGSGPLPRG